MKKFIKHRQEIIKMATEMDQVIKQRYIPPQLLKDILKQRGFEKICFWCGNELSGRRTTACSNKCYDDFFEHTNQTHIRYRLLKERGIKCEKCGKIPKSEYHDIIDDSQIEMHHIKPIQMGGDLFNDENLILLCHECHLEAHKELSSDLKIYKLKKRLKSHNLEEYKSEN